jgi:4-carboxymuconolactone decarboxylase
MPSSRPERDERWARGTAAYASQFRIGEDEVFDRLAATVGERMATEAILAAGGVWADDGVLSLRERSLVVVTALVTQSGVDARLRGHVRWALDHGVSPEELEAAIALLAVYVGYPKTSVAMEVVREVLAG